MIGGKRYLEGDTVIINNETRRGLGLQALSPGLLDKAKAEDWYTSDAMIIKATNDPPGYGGIRWGLLGIVLAEAVEDVLGAFTRLGTFVGDIARSLLDSDLEDHYDKIMSELRYAHTPLFGADEWDRAVFPDGKVDLEFTANLLLGITVTSYILSKIPGLAEGVAGMVSSLRARAVVNARHNAVMDGLDEIDNLISVIPKPVIESQFKMLDDQITPQAIRSLTEALVRDKASPLNKLYKTYPDWGLFPE